VLTLRISALFDTCTPFDQKHKNDHWLDDMSCRQYARERNAFSSRFEARSVHRFIVVTYPRSTRSKSEHVQCTRCGSAG
jgi:hypothetical protein